MDTSSVKKILLVEDCSESRALVCEIFRDMKIETAADLAEAKKLLAQKSYDLILLDILLPDGDGLKFYSMLKEQNPLEQCPTLILSGQGDIHNKVKAFSLGVEDFLTKPYHPEELRARVLAKLKKSDSAESQTLKLGSFSINKVTHKVIHHQGTSNIELDLTSKEFKLIMFFAQHLNRIISRETLLQELWGREVHVSDRTIDAHISNLRRKMENTGVGIIAVPNEGYRLVLEP